MPSIQMKRDATPDFLKPSLCDSCRNATVVEGMGLSERHVYCHAVSKNITFKVMNCNGFDNKGQPSLYDMRQTAFYLMTNKGKVENKIGFVSASEYRKGRESDDMTSGDDLNVPAGLPK